jgi:hypothetical protein
MSQRRFIQKITQKLPNNVGTSYIYHRTSALISWRVKMGFLLINRTIEE